MVQKEDRRSAEEERREAWLAELSEFIVEANLQTWAAGGAEVIPERQGYKELKYERGDWRLRDSYTGYFRAPGMTTVYYKDQPAWTMAYGGAGMVEGQEHLSSETFNFLKSALKRVSPDLPYRGPEEFDGDEWQYRFELVDGDIEDFLGVEEIYRGGTVVFTQTVIGGLVLHRNQDKSLQKPWDL